MCNAEGTTASSGSSTPSITVTDHQGVDVTILLSYNQLPIQGTKTAAPAEGVIMPETATTSTDWLVHRKMSSPDFTECVVDPREVLQSPDMVVALATTSNGHDHGESTALNDAREAATVLAPTSKVKNSGDEEATTSHASTTSIPTVKKTEPGEALRQVEEPGQPRHMDAPSATASSRNHGRSATRIVRACVDWNLRYQEDLNRLTESGLITVTPGSGISGTDVEINNIDLSTLDVEDLVKHRNNGLVTITVSVGPKRTPNATELATFKTCGLLEFNSPISAGMALLSELKTDHQNILQSASSTASEPIATEIMLQSSPQSESAPTSIATAWGAMAAEKMYQSAQKILLMHESAYKQAEITARIALEILCGKLGTDIKTFQEERRIVSVYQGVMDAGKNGANGEKHRGAITARVQQEDTVTGLHLDNRYALRKFKAAAELEKRKAEKEREEAASLAKEERARLAQEAAEREKREAEEAAASLAREQRAARLAQEVAQRKKREAEEAATASTTSVQWIPVLPPTPTVPNITLHCERCQEDAQLSTNDPELSIPILRLTAEVTTPHTCAEQATGVETAPPCNSYRIAEDVSAQVSVENANEMPDVPAARDSGAHTASKPSYATFGGPIGATAFRSSNSRVTTDRSS
jgi:hypothetical protein